MKKSTIIGMLLLVCLLIVPGCTSGAGKNINDTKLRHVVLFKFKDSATKEEVKVANDAFLALPDRIAEIKEFEWGLNNSPENHHQGLTHCYILTFESEEDLAVYLPHPDHKAFGEILGPILDKVVVVDYWTK